jgi:uncharacterized protein YbjT (DUF2867 family)
MENKIIFVTGGSGNQGNAVARSLIKNGFKVKTLSRKPQNANVQSLKKIGVEIIEGDLNDSSTYRDALVNVYGIFCVLSYDAGVDKEIRQGFRLADLAREAHVKHFVYSSVIGCDLDTGIPHWESKLKIENHIKHIGLPYTIIRPTSLYENFLIPPVKSRIVRGKLGTPVRKNVVQQFISVQDIGEITASVLLNPDKYLGKTLTIAAEELDMGSVSEIFTDAMGKPVTYQALPMFITRLLMGKDLAKMFRWVNHHNARFVEDLPSFKKDYPNLLPLKDWVRIHFR